MRHGDSEVSRSRADAGCVMRASDVPIESGRMNLDYDILPCGATLVGGQ